MTRIKRTRTPFTTEDDNYLMKYIAKYNPGKVNRMGNALYIRLVDNDEGRWPWAKRHTWHSWRERYKDKEDWFDASIRSYQKKKGIDPTEKKKQGKLSLKDLERSASAEASGSNANGAYDSDFSSPEPPTIRRLAKQPATQPNGRAERGGNEEPQPENEFPACLPRNMLATRPARKTAVVTTHSELEEGEIRSVEDGEIVSEAEIRIGDKKRKSDEAPVPSGSKRQRVRSDTSTTGEVANEVTTSQQPSQNGYLKAQGPLQRAPLSTNNTPRNLSPRSKVRQVLDDKQARALLFEALPSNPQGQQTATESPESQLNGEGPSSKPDTNNQERLYPQLMQEDYDVAAPLRSNSIPHSPNRTEDPITSTPANHRGQTNGAPGSRTAAKHVLVTPRAIDNRARSPSIGSPPRTRPRTSKKTIAVGYFETPSPSPERADAAPPGIPSPANSKADDREENKENNPVYSSPQSKHDSPQQGREPPTGSFVPSFRKPAAPLPRRKAPDLDSGSETEVIPEEAHPVREMNRRETPKESWPPLRKKNSSEVFAQTPRINSSMQRVAVEEHAKLPSSRPPASKVAQSPPKERPNLAPLTQNVDPTGSVPSRVVPSASNDKRQIGTGSIKTPAPKIAPDQKRVVSQAANSQPRRTVSIAGPSRANNSALQATSSENVNPADINTWRPQARTPNLHSASASMSTESDPFLTKDHASRLRHMEKGKGKEVPTTSAEPKVTSEAKARADRRRTFAGFPTFKPPEIDLRKKALRTSVVGNYPSNPARRLSFSPSVAIHSDGEQDEDGGENRVRRRASVRATIDLSQDFPSPDAEIPPTDRAFIMRAGVQVILQSIAQNHSVTEDFVRGIYEELMDLEATDRVVSNMRRVAERAVEEGLEHEKRKKRNSNVATEPASREPNARRQADPPSGAREADVSVVPERSRGRSVSGRRHSELLITPADEDPTFVRLRNQYVPPSTSRAARFVRRRARRSSGLANSPLQGYDKNGDYTQAGEYEDDEKEEEEVFMALTPGRMLDDTFASDEAELDYTSQNVSATAGPSNEARAADTSISRPWTAEEDAILILGEDEDAINAIEQRRGKRVVMWRIAELSAGDLLS